MDDEIPDDLKLLLLQYGYGYENESEENKYQYIDLTIEEKVSNLIDSMDIWLNMAKIHDEYKNIQLFAKITAYVDVYQTQTEKFKFIMNDMERLKISMKKQKRPGDVAKEKSIDRDLKIGVAALKYIKTNFFNMYTWIRRYYRSCQELEMGRKDILKKITKLNEENVGVDFGKQFYEKEKLLVKNKKSRLKINRINLSDVLANTVINFLESPFGLLKIISINVSSRMGENGGTNEMFEDCGKFKNDVFVRMVNDIKEEIMKCDNVEDRDENNNDENENDEIIGETIIKNKKKKKKGKK